MKPTFTWSRCIDELKNACVVLEHGNKALAQKLGTVILVSPHPVDGYPPVRHQAELLAEAGWTVELVTIPIVLGDGRVRFQYPDVRVHELPWGGLGFGNAVRRAARFIARLTDVRRKATHPVVEIAFEPTGILYSDLALGRPAVRLAHFHESLQSFETSRLQKRLVRAIHGFQRVTVPDPERGALLKDQLRLGEAPTVVQNYPRMIEVPPTPTGPKGASFEVIYCGTISSDQMLDLVVRSVALWPENVSLSLIGSIEKPAARSILRIAETTGVADRVNFPGWMAYEELPARLAAADLAISLLDPSQEQWRTALGASNKRYQFMQAGLAQLGDMNPGVPEMLEGQKIGSCVKAYTEEEIASLVAVYARDSQRCSEEGARAFQIFKERYNYEQSFRPVIDWLEAQVTLGRPAI